MSDLEKMMQLITILIQRTDIINVRLDNLKDANNELRANINKLNKKLEKDNKNEE